MMKKNIVLFILFCFQFGFSQTQKVEYLLDSEGKNYSFEGDNFRKILEENPDNSMGFRIVKDSGRIYQVNVPKYSTYKINSKIFKDTLQNITKKIYNDSTIFIISYHYLNDECGIWSSNKVSKELILSRKEFLKPIKEKIEKNKNIIHLELFEEGIVLENVFTNENEYFFNDNSNFFRNTIFLNPTVCGSYAIIKPDGLTLVRNGENRVDTMVEYLKKKKWNSIFKNYTK